MTRKRPHFLALAALLACAPPAPAAGPEAVTLVATPDGGIQPQAAVDAEGNLHLVYFKGAPAAGDLYYVRAADAPGPPRFSSPVRVNTVPGSAIAIGTIRGAQLALGRGGLVHVAWNGSDQARPANPITGAPMLYTRSLPGGGGFEPERNLMTHTYHLDGGGSLAADGAGHVAVAWHGRAKGDPDGETGRRLFVARSADDGATFTPEAPALDDRETRGACACCGTRSLFGPDGTFYALYRAASGPDASGRDMTLVSAAPNGNGPGRATTIAPWRAFVCPMSSESLVSAGPNVYAAWETDGRVAFARLGPGGPGTGPVLQPPGGGGRKHPALAVNARGEALLAWSEGTGWNRGGALAWRVFGADGRPTRTLGRLEGGVPVWGLPAAAARPDGGFLVVH